MPADNGFLSIPKTFWDTTHANDAFRLSSAPPSPGWENEPKIRGHTVLKLMQNNGFLNRERVSDFLGNFYKVGRWGIFPSLYPPLSRFHRRKFNPKSLTPYGDMQAENPCIDRR